jgi:hypothetical protein
MGIGKSRLEGATVRMRIHSEAERAGDFDLDAFLSAVNTARDRLLENETGRLPDAGDELGASSK